MRNSVVALSVAALTVTGFAYAVQARQAASTAKVVVYKSPT